MSMVKYMGQVATDMMEARFGVTDVYYVEKAINSPSFACIDVSCGLIWDRKHYAESCEARGHVSKWSQSYGGYIENGLHKGGATYPRYSIGRLAKDKRHSN